MEVLGLIVYYIAIISFFTFITWVVLYILYNVKAIFSIRDKVNGKN